MVKEEILLLFYGSELKYRELLIIYIIIFVVYKFGIILFVLRDFVVYKLLEYVSEFILEFVYKEIDCMR